MRFFRRQELEKKFDITNILLHNDKRCEQTGLHGGL